MCIMILSIISCTKKNKETNDEFKELLAEIDNKSIEEIKKEINSNVKTFEKFVSFFDDPSFKDEIKKIAKEDESYGSLYKIDTSKINDAMNQFADIKFQQQFESNKTKLKFIFPGRFNDPVSLGEGVSEYYTPQKVYYSNGKTETETEGFKKRVSSDFFYDWGNAIPIDSMKIDYKIKYITEIDSVTLSKNNPKVNYGGGEIRIEEIKDNYIYITKSSSIKEILKYQAMNDEGKILDGSSSMSGSFSPKRQKKVIRGLLSAFKTLQTKLNEDKFENASQVKDYIIKKFGKLDYFTRSSLYHKELFYRGNVASIKLFFEKESKKIETNFIARNISNYGDLIPMAKAKRDTTMFINKNGEEQFKVAGNYVAVNSRFYTDDKFYYHLNVAQKEMTKLLAFNITGMDKMVAVQQEESGLIALFDLENKQLSPYKYNEIYPYKNTILASMADKICRLDDLGNAKIIKDVLNIDDEIEGMIMVQSEKGKYGFLNSSGEIAVPLKYERTNSFTEGLAFVSKSDRKFGFIDKTGKEIIPFIYYSHYKSNGFENGVAIVQTKKGEILKLNKKGEILN